MTELTCPRCGGGLRGLATYCRTCEEYVEDMVASSPQEARTRAADAIPDDRLEGAIQEAGRKALELLGFTVYSFSQDRATRQTPGIADTYVAGKKRTTWAEWKRVGEVQSPDQIDFEETVTANGDEYHVWRHENEAIEWAKAAIKASR